MRVRIAHVTGRPLELRFIDPATGKRVRVSAGTRNVAKAERLAEELSAKLTLGMPVRELDLSPGMSWDDFRDHYRTHHLDELRAKSRSSAESSLNTCEAFVSVRTLAEMCRRDVLVAIRQKLLASNRSRHTAKSTFGALLAALNWACEQGVLESIPRLPQISTAKMRKMKGRPITGEEFERMLEVTPKVVGVAAAESWRHLLRGLWSSGLRLGELLSVSWDDATEIMPVWTDGRFPVLSIPAPKQKNDTEESIPLLPWFESVLVEMPHNLRHGFVFCPASLQGKLHRQPRHGRPTVDWCGKVVSRIGKAANVVVAPGKFASAHDLRRSCGERLLDAGVTPELIMAVMRHASWETTRKHYAPGETQSQARKLRECLESVT